MSVDDIFTVAIDANGHIVKISSDSSDVEQFIKDNDRWDLVVMSFCSLSEYYEYVSEHDYSVARI